MFGKVIAGREIYIKLKLAALDIIRIVRIVSFHLAKESLCYPFEGKKKEGSSENTSEEDREGYHKRHMLKL